MVCGRTQGKKKKEEDKPTEHEMYWPHFLPVAKKKKEERSCCCTAALKENFRRRRCQEFLSTDNVRILLHSPAYFPGAELTSQQVTGSVALLSSPGETRFGPL